MSSTNTFVQKFVSSHARNRQTLVKNLASEQHRLLHEYAEEERFLDASEERYLAFIEPILTRLEGLPDAVVIESINEVYESNAEVLLSAGPGVSISSLFLDYPAIPFSLSHNGSEVDPVKGEPVYSGLMVSTNPSKLHWQTMLGEQIVNVALTTQSLALDRWNNPTETGAPVASISVGDTGGDAWRSIGRKGAEYWVQPSNAQALALLDSAKSWRNNAALSAELREQFNERLAGIPTLQSAQAKIVVNALFAWSLGNEALPSKDDFSAWTPPRGNVVAMNSPQDWVALVADKPAAEKFANSAQEKIHTWSGRLPNIWRFVDEAGVATLCDAMAETRTRLVAGQSLSI